MLADVSLNCVTLKFRDSRDERADMSQFFFLLVSQRVSSRRIYERMKYTLCVCIFRRNPRRKTVVFVASPPTFDIRVTLDNFAASLLPSHLEESTSMRTKPCINRDKNNQHSAHFQLLRTPFAKYGRGMKIIRRIREADLFFLIHRGFGLPSLLFISFHQTSQKYKNRLGLFCSKT